MTRAPFRNQERRDRDEASEHEAYRAMYETVRAEKEASYNAEFGAAYRIKHPWKESFLTIHAEASRRLAERD